MKINKRFIRKITASTSFLTTAQLLMLPTITIKANQQVTVEQKYQLLTFNESEIILQFDTGKAIFRGVDFVIKLMYENELIIDGKIDQIIFQNEERL